MVSLGRLAEVIGPTADSRGIYRVTLFLSSLFSSLSVVVAWTVWSFVPSAGTAMRSALFNARPYFEGMWVWIYPYTRFILALLATQLLWLPVLVRGRRANPQSREESTAISMLSSRSAFHRHTLLMAPIALSSLVSLYRLLLGQPLTGDAHYYVSMMARMGHLGVGPAFSTDRPILFLILYGLKTGLSIEGERLLAYAQVGLSIGLVVATYFFVDSCVEDGKLAIVSAFFAAISPHVTEGIQHFIIANWLGLVLAMLLFAAVMRSLSAKSWPWVISAIGISWLILGVHFPTWAFTVLVLVTFSLACSWSSNRHRRVAMRYLIATTLGCLTPILPTLALGLVANDVCSTLSWSLHRVWDYIAQIAPPNIAGLFLGDALLSNYFSFRSYATPIALAFALLGLYRLYRIRESYARLIISWVAVASLGIMVIPNFEQWRLIYMMPFEVLSAVGLLHLLKSLSLVRERSVLVSAQKVLRRTAAVAACVPIVGAAILGVLVSPILTVLAFLGLVLILRHFLNRGEAREIVAFECVSFYFLVNVARVLAVLK